MSSLPQKCVVMTTLHLPIRERHGKMMTEQTQIMLGPRTEAYPSVLENPTGVSVSRPQIPKTPRPDTGSVCSRTSVPTVDQPGHR